MGKAVSNMSLSVMMIFLNQWWGMCCRPFIVFLKIQNSPGWLKGHPIGGLNIFISLSGKVALQKAFFSILCGGGFIDQWKYLWVGTGKSMRELRHIYHFYPSSGPYDCLTPQLYSWYCAVSCWSHNWLSNNTLMEWNVRLLVIYVSCILGIIWIDMSSCSGSCHIIQGSCRAIYHDPLRFLQWRLWGINVLCLWGFLHWKIARVMGWSSKTY